MANMLEDAVRFFGLTDDYDEAGYITPDGGLLDFSGRHMRAGILNDPFKPGARNIVHSNFLGINHQGYFFDKQYGIFRQEKNPVYYFMDQTGCVRCCHCGHFVSYIDTPTELQILKLSEMFNEEDIVIKHHTLEGQTIHCGLMKNTSLIKLKRWISAN